jgi:hypothetical protein
LAKIALPDYELVIHKIAILVRQKKADRGACSGVANVREAHMVDVVREKLPEGGAGGRFRRDDISAFRAFQPEGEIPLQTRCRCSVTLYIGQPKVAA